MSRWNAKVVWGFGLILFGLALAARELDFITFSIFFPGWWTFFIIIPCVKSIVQRTNGIITNIGLGLGLLLLLMSQGFASPELFGTLFVAIIFFVVGVSLILKKPSNDNYGKDYDKKDNKEYSHSCRKEYKANNESINIREDVEEQYNNNKKNENYSYHGGSHYTALLSANNYQYVHEEFTGATINSILGNVQLDLRNAIIYENSVIDVTCILGGIDIYVPANIRIVNQCTAILAGVDANVISPRNMSEDSFTIYIKGNCLLGGIEIK